MSNLYTLAEAVRRVESVPVEAQTILKDVILETLYRKKSAACFRECGERIALLEQAELTIRVDAPDVAMDFLGRNEIIKRLDDCGVVGFKRNMKLEDLVLWCQSEHLDICAMTNDIEVVVPHPMLERTRKKIYIYLGRKLENDGYYDPEKESYVEYPKGAEYRGMMGVFNGEHKSGWFYKDDEINRLLEKYGHLRCPIWDGPKEDFRD